MRIHRLPLAVFIGALFAGCAAENPVGPGVVTITASTSTTTTSTVAPTAKAQFVFTPTTPAALQPVFFNAFGSAAGRGTNIVTFAWDFGDGGTATGMSVSHTYTDQALYVVTLRVTDDVGDTAQVAQIVGAIAPPVTTTIPPAAGAAQYVGNQSNPTIPSDMTLFFRLLTSAGPSAAEDAAGLQAAAGDQRYRVEGNFRTPNGTTGTVTGEMLGTLQPKPSGTFSGSLTANPSGCSAVRNFSGTNDPVSLQWTAGSMVRNTCATNPLGFTSLNLVLSDAPPATTTSTIPTTPTTTIPTTTTSTTISTTTIPTTTIPTTTTTSTIPTTTIPTTTTTSTIPTTTTTSVATTTTTSSSTTTTSVVIILLKNAPRAR